MSENFFLEYNDTRSLGALWVRPWSGHGQVMVRSWSGHGQVMVRSWSGHGQVMVMVNNVGLNFIWECMNSIYEFSEHDDFYMGEKYDIKMSLVQSTDFLPYMNSVNMIMLPRPVLSPCMNPPKKPLPPPPIPPHCGWGSGFGFAVVACRRQAANRRTTNFSILLPSGWLSGVRWRGQRQYL